MGTAWIAIAKLVTSNPTRILTTIDPRSTKFSKTARALPVCMQAREKLKVKHVQPATYLTLSRCCRSTRNSTYVTVGPDTSLYASVVKISLSGSISPHSLFIAPKAHLFSLRFSRSRHPRRVAMLQLHRRWRSHLATQETKASDKS